MTPPSTPLTPTHEDYIEIIWRLQKDRPDGIRVTDLAHELGCRLPTVTRTVGVLAKEKLVDHKSRGLVRLTPRGEAMAAEVAHRHDDLVAFLELVLGMPEDAAEADACRLEHGLSRLASERLHAFLERYETLSMSVRRSLRSAVKVASKQHADFTNLVELKVHGWRR